ncbi:MAG: DUF3043 domain-containing protein [Nakamurella multipartita]
MSFLRRKPADEPAAEPVVEPTPEPPADGKKGRPTPKRREAEGRTRGPVAPPPKTQREAMKRSKEQRSSMSKDERRAAARTNRERMMAGDERYLLPRDRGKVRAYVRDLVDARRNVAGILLPIAVLSFVILLVPVQLIQAYGPLVLLVAIAAAVIDSIIFGRQISKKVALPRRATALGQSTKGYSLGFYAFNRCT